MLSERLPGGEAEEGSARIALGLKQVAQKGGAALPVGVTGTRNEGYVLLVWEEGALCSQAAVVA